MRGEVGPPAAFPQVIYHVPDVCKSLGEGYPGSKPIAVTRRRNGLFADEGVIACWRCRRVGAVRQVVIFQG